MCVLFEIGMGSVLTIMTHDPTDSEFLESRLLVKLEFPAAKDSPLFVGKDILVLHVELSTNP